jgi:hypothetical protein
MKQSETLGGLAAALSKAQSEFPFVPMNATNPFLHNRYADLGAVIETAKPILAKHGLSVSQLVSGTDGAVGISTILMHSSGEWLSSHVSLPMGEEKGKSMAQVAGSIVTYLRRYSYASILGLYADEDTDGGPGDPNRQPKQQPARQAPEKPQGQPIQRMDPPAQAPAPNGTGEMASEPQLKKVWAMWQQFGWTKEEGLEHCANGHSGRGPRQLTKREASAYIDALTALAGGQ